MDPIIELLNELFEEKIAGSELEDELLTVFNTYASNGYELTPDLADATGHFIRAHIDYLFDFAEFVITGNDYSLHNSFYKHPGLSLDDFVLRRCVFPEWEHMIFSSNHRPIEADAGCELAKLGYAPDNIEQLFPVIIDHFDDIMSNYAAVGVNYQAHYDKALSAAIRLSCKGDYQCPVSLKSHVKNSKNVFKKFPWLINELSYDGSEFISNVFDRAARVFNLDDDFIDECNVYLVRIKSHPGFLSNWQATGSAIVYLVGRGGYGLTQKSVSDGLGLASESLIRSTYKRINNFSI